MIGLTYLFRAQVAIFVFGAFMCFNAIAGGITVGGTRVIYPANAKSVDVSIKNTSSHSVYLVQSWVEDAQQKKIATSSLRLRCTPAIREMKIFFA